MARPSRCRRVCLEPEYDRFAPDGPGAGEAVLLTVDEYETIRLIDYEGLTHEQCARQMGISRTTVTEIYEHARFQLSDCLVNGKTLHITGGNYRLCDGSARACCGRRCGRAELIPGNPQHDKGESIMKIAVTYDNGMIFQHFGHTEQFKLYDVQDGKVTGTRIVGTEGSGHGALAGLLAGLGVDTLICGGIGGGAQNALSAAGIRLFGGVSGSADAAVEALLSGGLNYNPDVHCDHHGEGHTCGHPGEGHPGCGGSCH